MPAKFALLGMPSNFAVSSDNAAPSLGAVNVARTRCTEFEVAELVEHEQWVTACAFEVIVPDALPLLAMGRADTGIHSEHDATGERQAFARSDELEIIFAQRRSRRSEHRDLLTAIDDGDLGRTIPRDGEIIE